MPCLQCFNLESLFEVSSVAPIVSLHKVSGPVCFNFTLLTYEVYTSSITEARQSCDSKETPIHYFVKISKEKVGSKRLD